MFTIIAALAVLAAQPSPEDAPCTTTSSSADERALVASAIGLERLAAGDDEGAIRCLEAARLALPSSAVIARDLAVAYKIAGRPHDALGEVDAAIALGDADAEATELRALLLAELERPEEAADAARARPSWEGELIAAALGDPAAANRASELALEETSRGALASIVLSAHAGARGEETAARLLAHNAEALAGTARAPELSAAARALGESLDSRRGARFGARVRASIEHATNPAFLADPKPEQSRGLRLALLGEAALRIPVGNARLDTALRVDQHVFLTRREAFGELDLFGLALAAGVELPISRHPSAASVGLRARFSDTFGDAFRVHYVTVLEGGPSLALPISSALRLELGFYGVAADFIDRSPADANISSLNRDFVGQRATLALMFATEWLDGRAEAMFLRDDAEGEAFDSFGGAIAARVRARPSADVELSTGFALTARDYGPVGERAIIGPASTRTELRTAIELGARIALNESMWFVVEDSWVQNNARRLHEYTENVLSIGVEQTW